MNIFNISGGIGKNIMATSVVASLKEQDPDSEIHITTPYNSVWKNNPDVSSVSDIEKSPNFYKDYILDKNPKIFRLEPYSSGDYFYRKKHLIDVWCDLYNIKNTKEPKIFITKKEIESAREKLGDKKIFLIQTNGGADNQPYPISWARDLPLHTAEEVCKEMKKEGYRVIHLRRPDQPQLENAEHVNMTFRETLAAIELSNKRLFIDSVFQHAAKALNKPSIVLWIVNDPKVFGYDLHKNILPDSNVDYRHRMETFIEPYNIVGALHEYPYSTENVFSTKFILESLLED